MQAFSELFEQLDTTTATSVKVAAMVRYFRAAPPADAAWAAYILSGRRLKRFLGPTLLYRWLIDAAALPAWLIEESVAAVGDMAETIALLMENTATAAAASHISLADWIDGRLLPLRAAPVEEQHAALPKNADRLPFQLTDLSITIPCQAGGDAMSRLRVRFEEAAEAFRLVREAL